MMDNDKVEDSKCITLKNTLLIDSDAFKVRDAQANAVVIEPYTIEEIMNPCSDSYLPQVQEFILKLLDEADDIPAYLKDNQFIFKK